MVSLARASVLARIATALALVTTFAAVTAAVSMSRHEVDPPLELIPAVAARWLAWGAGVMLAFAAAVQALKRDRDDGVRALLRARGTSRSGYIAARVAGVAIAIAIVVGGGTLAAGLTAVLAASHASTALPAVQATAASLVYALAFSATLAPLALATVGARSRAGGYFLLLLLVVLPDVFAPWTASMLPAAWGDVVSIPAALSSVRSALMPGGEDVARLARAFAVLAALCLAASLSIVRGVPREGSEPAT